MRARLIRGMGLFVGLLVVLVAAGASLPSMVRLAVGATSHACRCEVRGGHAQCACPICFPELRDHDAMGHPEVTGTCGDEDPLFRALTVPAVLAPGFVLAAPAAVVEEGRGLPLRRTQWSAPPHLRPPISARSLRSA